MSSHKKTRKSGIYTFFSILSIALGVFVYFKTSSWKLAAIAAATCLILVILVKIFSTKTLRRCREPADYVSWRYFEENWIKEGQKNEGYKYNDRPGCYVILVFGKPVRGKNFEGYENVYVGQSVKVHQRVHNHFTGHGNGDVYADKKNGKYLYVRFVYSDRYSLNDNEVRLIDLYNAQESYNRTAGGAKITE